MDKVNYYRDELDKELSKYRVFHEIEAFAGVHKTILASGFGAVFFIFLVFNFAGSLITNLVAFVYPAYASFQAIESPGKEDDKQWLTYWIVVAFFSLIEYFTDFLLYWVPFYYLMKTAFLIYLFLPYFRGAEHVYQSTLRPFILEYSKKLEYHFSSVNTSAKKE
ncbi:receptor accessory protein 5 [Neoconidiobolus thromboides FSU 785]|nr:receptor accessory protein 5 [Neoconidiobolus thromboides FSU 785]